MERGSKGWAMQRDEAQRIKVANARLLLTILKREAIIVAPVTALLLYLITHRLDVALGIGAAVCLCGTVAYFVMKRIFEKQGALEIPPSKTKQ